jgi:uncharacterized protein (UPF0335 family)
MSDGNVVSAERLKSFIKRIEKIAEDKDAVNEDLREVYSECASAGFDTKIVRKVVALRKKEIETRREENQIMSLYLSALGMDD